MLLEKIILLNSANFNFLEIDLKKDLFFLGDNGSGKTSLIRAIHYLFSADTQSLGIPTDKEGFKEYYFKYANSYILYVFDDFFIFMYKTSGEIAKLFSKQKFELHNILDEENHLLPLDRIKKYAKTPNLSVTARGVSDYRDIVYGHNKRYLDFSFIAIKNSDIFIGLFNEIFNIDKSIIDSKSIKKTIQTTLDYEKRVVDFDYDEYLQKIYEFQSNYKFFQEFEKQKGSIDEAQRIKNILIEVEKQFQALKEKIVYRVQYEKEMAVSITKEILDIDKNIQKIDVCKKIKTAALSRYSAKTKEILDDLTLEIKELRGLKEKFNENNLLHNQNLSDRYLQIKGQSDQVHASIIKLQEGFDDALKSIQREIDNLKYTRDQELLREKNNQEENQKQLLKSKFSGQKEKLELEFESKKERSEHSINELYQSISTINATIEIEKEKVNQTKKEKSEKEHTLRETTHIQKNKEQETIQTLRNESAANRQKSDLLLFDEQKIQREFEAAKKEKTLSKEEEERRLDKEKQKYQAMIHSKENSFKEFLNEEVDDWERVLYPILDSELLDMSKEDLKPVLLSASSLLGIDIDTTKLKHILTHTQAEEAIKKIEGEKTAIKESFSAIMVQLEKEYEEDRAKVETKRSLFKEANANIESKIKECESAIETLEKRYQEDVTLMRDEYIRRENVFNETHTTLQAQKGERNTHIQTLKQEIKIEKTTLDKKLADLANTLQEEMKHAEKETNLWLQTRQREINNLINQKEADKANITKDARLQELEKEKRVLDEALTQCLHAKNFLDSYEKAKEKIGFLHKKENEYLTFQTKNKRFKQRLDEKIEYSIQKGNDLLKNKNDATEVMKEITMGIKAVQAHKAIIEDLPHQKTDEYLRVLIVKYTELAREYKDKKIDLKGALDKINQLKNTHHQLDTSFKFDEFDKVEFISDVPNIIAKIDEIAEFKNKKIDTIKQSGHKDFFNFVKNRLPQKISVFSDTEDKFISQVAKINKNLTKIDFGVIKNIKIETTSGDKKSIARLLVELNENISDLSSLLNETSLFYDRKEVIVELEKLEKKFKQISQELKGNAISLIDTIDLSLSFMENGTQKTHISQIKNESSTGGSILLKIAIAISILELFISDQKTPFFLIVDEVSRLHSINQERLREFANAKGFGIIFVTPEPTYSKPDVIKYYRFTKNSEDQFEVIELNE